MKSETHDHDSMHVFSRKLTFLGVIFLFLTLGIGAWFHSALAQTALDTVGTSSGLPTENIAIIIARIIRIVLSILGIIVVVLILYGGWIFMTSQGDPTKVKKAIAIIKNTVIGLIIILTSYAITSFILDRLIDAAGLGGVSSVSDQYIEPLSGSLGGGIIEDHYPARNAMDIPRNTKIIVTFKEAMDVASFVNGYADDTTSTDLNVGNVLIYPTALGETSAFLADGVVVSYDVHHEIFVFDPVDLLGSAEEDTNYTVVLGDGIVKADGEEAFTGVYGDGYQWTFEVSTEVDLTPPTVTYVIPPITSTDAFDRNISVEITFSEAMDPVAATGTYDGMSAFFDNAAVYQMTGGQYQVTGTFEIGNNYRTITFTTDDVCGVDPCGDEIYCLPGLQTIQVEAHAATLGTEPPGALMTSGTYDGLTDICGNSLDGDDSGTTIGSDLDTVTGLDETGAIITNDDYTWDFTTTNNVNDTVPEIISLDPGVGEDEADNLDEVDVEFSVLMKATTLSTSTVSLWPDPFYEMWFSVHKTDSTTKTTVSITHPTLVSTEDGGWDYYPVITNDVKSSYQICLYPAYGPSATEGSLVGCEAGLGGDREETGEVYCCDGVRSSTPCAASTGGFELPYTPSEY
ncbi:MAG: hypothetical protein UX57_C0013G0013 [Candidatus Uhrbacteria bacterium GW2011_GWE2_46_68]|uniref:SbsA Ig-like domain-containing protein n=2 Tax=Candidatus Uhriibacteriota TaxID=1752732 RepID=A0A0G1Q735_9BACT|nr:MAG: hypothetical protein UX45_C0025G0014 [Candidatus Uhrbacteria bacterium GW2011_GWF2_46_218]KKU40617.1 MAG: hypothetical protein UX57_C0013G0013 [Candidatus Uhrbacteria bacterium GW2011_GWE2_46_68]